jgi:hypothetical protein
MSETDHDFFRNTWFIQSASLYTMYGYIYAIIPVLSLCSSVIFKELHTAARHNALSLFILVHAVFFIHCNFLDFVDL